MNRFFLIACTFAPLNLILGSMVSQAAPVSVPVFDVPQLSGIVVDGDRRDWGERGFRIDAMAGHGIQEPPAGFAPSCRLGWDERGLLALVTVRQRTHYEDPSEDYLWKADSVELFLGAGPASKDVVQVVISPGLDPAHPKLRTHFYDLRNSADLKKTPPSAEVSRSPLPGEYLIEVRLPWSNLGITPAVGRVVAFQAQVNTLDRDRYQALWGPTPGGADASTMCRLRLSKRASPPVEVAASAGYERFRRVRVLVTAAAGLAGASVEVKERRRVLGRGVLAMGGGQASGAVNLPMPERGRRYGPISAVVRGHTAAKIDLPDPESQRREALAKAELNFHPSVFSGTALPSCDFDQPSLVEDLAGRYTIHVRYFDSDYNEVTTAEKPGRYGAIVEVSTEDGGSSRHLLTLFRMPDSVNWRETKVRVSMELPKEFGISSAVLKEQGEAVSEYLTSSLVDSFSHSNDAAVMLAGLYETPPGSPPATNRTSPWSAERKWIAGLKWKMGFLNQRYLASVPSAYESDSQKKWPLVLFLHGSGERGNDLERVKTHGIPELVAAGKDFPFIAISPQCPDGEWWNPWELRYLLDEIEVKYRVDPDRVYLTGLSMGGYGTWEMALDFPDRFAAIVPICGGGDPADAARLKDVPVWAFHGGKDPVVPLKGEEEMVDAVKKAGGDARLTIYPEAGHDAWTETYANEEVYTWLLQHRRIHE